MVGGCAVVWAAEDVVELPVLPIGSLLSVRDDRLATLDWCEVEVFP